ncbi:trans-aconitate 2-methyltransferase [Mesorhizobium sp. M5C.F.Ca.IN.020.32.2.1]|uniref:trans-aconitate 2-methyltransferase n=1 Tax=Mesorhizobium sp. M5C.F.Ca.IN.020.32.2.1 TaxID=2496771 RepID=UPI000FD5DC17|nr:trans-aconitate 2-methyltransferase [Mesorhizobium sp. M5C.F.Ca.IN.020.32.2.1]RUV28044.1 trans-aconitate 2-methyltransferase [Mesorhizobium sp. M5C.F.Ca.IN.020.32.2.1]
MSSDWSPAKYLQFGDHRTRPAIDLLGAVPNEDVEFVTDIGCGPGNSTELLLARYPKARVAGIDSSSSMIDAARARLPNVEFAVQAIEDWRPEQPQDVIFANAVLQWLPGHGALLPRLANLLKSGGTLAIQMPDNLDEPTHRGMREVARDPRWAGRLAEADAERTSIESPQNYYGMLRPFCRRVEVWRTIYHHPLEGLDGIIDWFSSTGLRPYLSRLDASEKKAYLAAYRETLARHYPVLEDGTTLLPFPRLFIVVTRL